MIVITRIFVFAFIRMYKPPSYDDVMTEKTISPVTTNRITKPAKKCNFLQNTIDSCEKLDNVKFLQKIRCNDSK